VAGVNNNPNFAIRLVAEFESTIVDGSTNNYVAVTNNYGSGGTLWLDMVTFTGSTYVPPVTGPQLTVQQSGSSIQIAWTNDVVAYTLQATSDLTAPSWQTVTEVPVVNGNQSVVTVPISGTARFFRLSR
jgi:hypothetical protein